MKYLLDPTGTPDGLRKATQECLEQHTPQGLMILAGCENSFTPADIDPILHSIPVPLLGGIFPGIIHNCDLSRRGSLVLALKDRPRIQVVHHLSDSAADFDAVLDGALLDNDGKTMFVLVDGLAERIDALLSALFCCYGIEVNYLGGGAGCQDNPSAPCLLTNKGMIHDAAILAVTSTPSGVGVAHGLEYVSGPHIVSDIVGNRIGSIDWKPARDRFLELIKQADPSLGDKTEFPISNDFCLGVQRIGGEQVIRDPFRADPDGALYVVSPLAEGGFVDIMRATPEALIGAASQALDLARQAYGPDPHYSSVISFDCFTRESFLRDRFPEELAAMQDDHCALLGALTLGGEIANCGMEFLDYHNRTCVTGVLE